MTITSDVVRMERHGLPAGDAVAWRIVGAENVSETPPTVFVLHGLNSRKERHLDLCLRLARSGFAAVALDAAFHGERGTYETANRLAQDVRSPDFGELFAVVVMQTVEDIAHFATELGLTHYGVIGHSMGGFIALQTALADDRAQAIVVVGGALDVSGFVGENHAGDPATHAPHFAPRALLLLHGTEDTVVPVDGARRLYNRLRPHYAAEAAEFLRLDELTGAGHEWTPDIAERSVAWMTTHLQKNGED